MKDMKPDREPADIVFHGGGSSRETVTREGPSPFKSVEVDETRQTSAVKEGGYTCNCADDLNTLLYEQHPDTAERVRRGEVETTVVCPHGKTFTVSNLS